MARKSTKSHIESKKIKKRKILFVAAESSPFASVGGVSRVISYLSKALADLGHDVRVFMPKFGSIEEDLYEFDMVCEGLKVPTDDENNPHLICNVKSARADNGVTTYFLENQEYYEKRANVYGYSDDPTRWALLARGALEFIKKGDFVPDVIHCNDWHSGLLPNYAKSAYRKDKRISKIPLVFTIHNMSYQGMFDHHHVSELEYDDGKSHIPSFFADRLNTLNFLKRGIMYADVVNTVSKTYAREILTSEYGEGLDRLLLELKGKLFGIINGIDYDEMNPATDTLIEQSYDINTRDLRKNNKRALQQEFNLPERPKTPLFGFVGRVTFQKGIDLLIPTLRHVIKEFDIQFVHVGGGEGGLIDQLTQLQADFPDKVGVHPYPNFTLPRLIFSGCDFIFFPSRFEPCGVVQLEAMRYGAIPIVRKVGGLADTVENFESSTGKGTGFVFEHFEDFSLFAQIVRAVEIYKNDKLWPKLQKSAMEQDFSWDYSAKEYLKLYDSAVQFRVKKSPNEKMIDDII